MGIVRKVNLANENKKLKTNTGMFCTNLATSLSNKNIYDNNEKGFEWLYLQDFPANYSISVSDPVCTVTKNGDTSDLPINNLLNFSWYKCLVVDEEDLVKSTGKLTGIITYKNANNKNKLKFKILSGDLVEEIHGK